MRQKLESVKPEMLPNNGNPLLPGLSLRERQRPCFQLASYGKSIERLNPSPATRAGAIETARAHPNARGREDGSPREHGVMARYHSPARAAAVMQRSPTGCRPGHGRLQSSIPARCGVPPATSVIAAGKSAGESCRPEERTMPTVNQPMEYLQDIGAAAIICHPHPSRNEDSTQAGQIDPSGIFGYPACGTCGSLI